VKVWCLAISSPRFHVNERRNDAGSCEFAGSVRPRQQPRLCCSSYIPVRTVAFDSSPRGWANLCSRQLQRTGGSGARQQHTPGKNGASTPNSFHQVDRVLLRNLLAGCVTYKLCLRRGYGKRNSFQLSTKYHVNLRADIAQGVDGHTFAMGVGEAF
jgi:hypothetical protein